MYVPFCGFSMKNSLRIVCVMTFVLLTHTPTLASLLTVCVWKYFTATSWLPNWPPYTTPNPPRPSVCKPTRFSFRFPLVSNMSPVKMTLSSRLSIHRNYVYLSGEGKDLPNIRKKQTYRWWYNIICFNFVIIVMKRSLCNISNLQ